MARSIELIARAVLTVDGQVLLVRKKGESYTFLPGGHIEFGESAESALARELHEELEIPVRVGTFLGAIENCFSNTEGWFHELNLVFAAALPNATSPSSVTSREPHLAFLWQPPSRLADQNLQPAVLRALVPEWIERKSIGRWVSAMTMI